MENNPDKFAQIWSLIFKNDPHIGYAILSYVIFYFERSLNEFEEGSR